MRKKILAVLCAMVLAGVPQSASAAGKTFRYGGWWTREVIYVIYEGSAWAHPCVSHNEKQAFQASIRFYAGSPGRRDTGWIRSAAAANPGDCSTKSVTKAYRDTLQWDPGYKTQFRYSFAWRPVGAYTAGNPGEEFSAHGIH